MFGASAATIALSLSSLMACQADGEPAESLSSSVERSDAGADACSSTSGCDGRSERPPVEDGLDAIHAWIAEGHYKRWRCEDAAHDSRPPSGHSPNRICSNAVASAHDAGEYPVGAVTFKELYSDDASQIVGYALAVKVAPGGGEAWHWFEELDGRVIANGRGDTGTPKRVCVGCHKRAGTTVSFGHDLVFTQVR